MRKIWSEMYLVFVSISIASQLLNCLYAQSVSSDSLPVYPSNSALSSIGNALNTPSDMMVVRGHILEHDTKTNITTADGKAGLARAIWGQGSRTEKTIQAKIIRAKMIDSSSDCALNSTNTSNSQTECVADKPVSNKSDATQNFGEDVEWIEADGNVFVTFPNRTMSADYCKSAGKVIQCKGNVVIHAGRNEVKGDKGSFDLENDRYEISMDSAQQVQATVYMDKKKK